MGNEAEAGVIFETMNNRGKQITELEKVKNYLLYLSSKLNLEEEHALVSDVNDTWTHIFEHLMAAGLGSEDYEDQLLRAHWLMAYDYQARNWQGSRSIKERFNLRRYQGRHLDLLDDVRAYVGTLRNAATAYCDVSSPLHSDAFNAFKSDGQFHQRVVSVSEKLARLRLVAPFLPLLIAVRLKFPDDAEAYLNTAKLCERFAFRVYRWRPGSRSDTGSSTLYRVGYELFLGHELPGVLDELRRALLRYCSDERFKERFRLSEENDWYGWAGIKYFLYEYEEHLAQAASKPVKMPWAEVEQRLKKDTVEHILPRTPKKGGYWTTGFSAESRRMYTHDIGNLCLTYDNSELGNKPFPEKRGTPGGSTGYVNSVLFTEKQLGRHNDWTEPILLARRGEIKAWAIKRWHVEPPPPPPNSVQELVEQYGVGDEFHAVLETAQRHGVYARFERKCVRYTPPSNHTRALFTVWPKPGRLSVGVWHAAFPDFFAVTSEHTRAILGSDRLRTISASDVHQFLGSLDRLFEEIAKGPS